MSMSQELVAARVMDAASGRPGSLSPGLGRRLPAPRERGAGRTGDVLDSRGAPARLGIEGHEIALEDGHPDVDGEAERGQLGDLEWVVMGPHAGGKQTRGLARLIRGEMTLQQPGDEALDLDEGLPADVGHDPRL